MTLAERLVALHRALDAASIPHAFGGAIALAYWTLNPRGTSDLDVNLFVPADDSEPALAALPAGVARPQGTSERIAREGQVRLWWEATPVDLFFDYHPLHARAARRRREVPFEDGSIPVLGPVELAAFKALFDRRRDWADIEEMIAARSLDPGELRALLETVLPPGDHRFARLSELTG